VKNVVANFAAAVCRDGPPPVLVASPLVRLHRPQQLLPPSVRRSERLVKKSRLRATKSALQAQNVMMKLMGLTSASHAPDASSYQQFVATFSSDLTTSQVEALDALLPSGMGAMAEDLVEPTQPL
jgi:hypothetical protein